MLEVNLRGCRNLQFSKVRKRAQQSKGKVHAVYIRRLRNKISEVREEMKLEEQVETIA